MPKKKNFFLVSFLSWWFLLLPFDYSVIGLPFVQLRALIYGVLNSFDSSLIFESDSLGMYLLVPVSLILAGLTSPILSFFFRKSEISTSNLAHHLFVGFVCFFLFKYGWEKITKQQFYLPEPNTVYTPFGQLTKDLAFWSLLGSTYGLVVVIGILELLTAVLLIFRRTRFFGSLMAIGIMTVIFVINCFFDISVKLFSVELLLFSIAISCYYPEKWSTLFALNSKNNGLTFPRNNKKLFALFIIVACIEVITPTIQSGNWNDDLAQRPKYEGAYILQGNTQIKRFYIHRKGYFIIEKTDGTWVDFPIQKTTSIALIFNAKRLIINWKSKRLQLDDNSYPFYKIAYTQLPLMHASFHFFSDDFH